MSVSRIVLTVALLLIVGIMLFASDATLELLIKPFVPGLDGVTNVDQVCTDRNLRDKLVYIQKNGCELKNTHRTVIEVLNNCDVVNFHFQVSAKRSEVSYGNFDVGRVDNVCLPSYLIKKR